MKADLDVTPPAGVSPVTTTVDTTGSDVDCGDLIRSFLFFAGDGGVVSLVATLAQQFQYEYPIPGFYSAQLFLSETGGHSTTSLPQPVVVAGGVDGNQLPPTVTINIQPQSAARSFLFTSTVVEQPGDPVVMHLWDFGDGGATSSQKMPTHTYAQAGIFQVEFIVTTLKGMAAFARAIVVIEDTQGSTPASMLVGAVPAETMPDQPVVLNAFIDNLNGASVLSASVAWPDGNDTSPMIMPAANGGVVITSSRIITESNEYDIPVSVATSTGAELSGLGHVLVTNPDGSQPSPVGLSKPWPQATVGSAYEVNGPGSPTRTLMVRGLGPFTIAPVQPSPAGLTVDGAGNINWQATEDEVGNQPINVQITDSLGNARVQKWVVAVTQPSGAKGCGCDFSGTEPPFSLLALIAVAVATVRARQRRST